MIVHWPRETGEDAQSAIRDRLDYASAYRHISSVARRRVLSGSDVHDTHAAPTALGGAAVLILATPHVDSLAALRILTQLLANDEIAFRVAPVNGYRALQHILAQDVHGHIELHTLVFLNLGSLLPLDETVPLPPHCTLHVIDSHRPWNLGNLFATSQINDRIWVWDDGDIEQRLGMEREAYETLEFDFESDSDTEEEKDDERGSEAGGEVGDDAGSDANSASSSSDKKRRHSHPSPPPKRARIDPSERQAYRGVLARYYARGSWYGMSTAQMMYMLAVALGRSDIDSLWMAILGLTSQYMSNAIHASTYEGYAAALASDVVAMNAIYEDNDTRAPLSSGAQIHGADDNSIRVLPEELRFTLYRHWSLEMSMYHTSYVAAKLGIWREKGIHKLRGLLAKMGLSLANCRQTYEHMELDLRQSLVQRMESIAPEYGLVDLSFRSFMRAYGYRAMPISAADAVEGISALLQAAHGVRIEVDGVHIMRTESGKTGGSRASMDRSTFSTYGGRTLWALSDDGAEAIGPPLLDAKEIEKDREAHADTPDIDTDNLISADWVKNFFEAYRAMDVHKPQNVALLQASLKLAKSLHEAIVEQGVSIIVKQSVKTLRSFRLTILQDGPSLHLFINPDTLTRLGFWLIDALRDIVNEQHARRIEARRERRRSKGNTDDSDLTSAVTSLPFVLAALDAPRDVFTVVGIVGAPDYGDVSKNRFGLAFQDAAHLSGAHMRNDRFESSVLEVKRSDLMPFVEALHLKA